MRPGPNDRDPPAPTRKRIEYAEIVGPGRYLNGPTRGELTRMRLAVTVVFDDGTRKDVNRAELDWHRAYGAEILMPNVKPTGRPAAQPLDCPR